MLSAIPIAIAFAGAAAAVARVIHEHLLVSGWMPQDAIAPSSFLSPTEPERAAER